jgi:hypothetical protein
LSKGLGGVIRTNPKKRKEPPNPVVQVKITPEGSETTGGRLYEA